MLNFNLLANPLNWLTVFAMLAVAGVLVTLINSQLDTGSN